MNTISVIFFRVDTIRSQMKDLKYLSESTQWIRPCYATMPKQYKSLIAKTFQVSRDKNTKCIIIVATNAYDIEIENLDIKLVI